MELELKLKFFHFFELRLELKLIPWKVLELELKLVLNELSKGLTIRTIIDYVSKHKECVICFEPLNNERSIMKLTCHHEFHEGCIKPWLKDKRQCPMCRHHIVPENEFPALNAQF